MSKKMVIVVTAVGVRKVVEKWLCENMTCELVVSVTHAMSVVWKSSMIAETLRFCVLFYALPWVKS